MTETWAGNVYVCNTSSCLGGRAVLPTRWTACKKKKKEIQTCIDKSAGLKLGQIQTVSKSPRAYNPCHNYRDCIILDGNFLFQVARRKHTCKFPSIWPEICRAVQCFVATYALFDTRRVDCKYLWHRILFSIAGIYLKTETLLS